MTTDSTTTDGSGDAGLVDWENARVMTNNDNDMLVDMVEAMLEEMPMRLAAIGKAIESRQAKDLEIAGHSLKNLMGYLGIKHGRERALHLELAGRSKDFSDTEDAHRVLSDLVPRVLPLLTDFLRRERSS